MLHQQQPSNTTAADAPAKVQMSRDSNSGVTQWSVEEGALNRELEAQDLFTKPKTEKADPKRKKLNKLSGKPNTNELTARLALPRKLSRLFRRT